MVESPPIRSATEAERQPHWLAVNHPLPITILLFLFFPLLSILLHLYRVVLCSGVVANSTVNNNNAPQGYYYYTQAYDGNNNVHPSMTTHQNSGPHHQNQQTDGGGANR
ncbi:hypothetical protein CDAR_42111 [Caerostris darwini]|uniref:Uncharacterized protein n=1 Tax=Caerostris darwini TaxID=1538125 RepID=A0AAV4RKM9_9ARAC|nr:hypothetical protein CDAR_42111 [Caerostris darwini]